MYSTCMQSARTFSEGLLLGRDWDQLSLRWNGDGRMGVGHGMPVAVAAAAALLEPPIKNCGCSRNSAEMTAHVHEYKHGKNFNSMF